MGLQRGHITVAEVEVSGIRSLARADLTLLLEKRPQVQLQSIRDSHHRIARAVAAGLSNIDVAAICGISANRVAVLKSDPAFVELTAHYRATVTADWVQSADSFMEVATANMLKAEVMLSDKLDDAIDKNEMLPTRDLIAISSDRADRFGYGKTQKNLNINVDFAANLERARQRASRARDVTPSPSLAPQIEAPHSRPQSVSASAPAQTLAPRPPSFRRV